ncbi:hypothetical protein FWD07_01385 [Candidatus Saccharibacteria bacterium]|nr:hypothetical protein [Candidatus Saccharibacteria bacterium]
MKIVIVGYGKMGHIIEYAAKERGIEIVAIVNCWPPQHETPPNFYKTLHDLPIHLAPDHFRECIFIDFTEPNSALSNIEFYCKNKLNCVIGTTGYWRKPENLILTQQLVEEAGIALVHGSNFSTPVHVTMIANRLIAAMLHNEELYDVSIHEAHHPMKLDPSGTGITMGEDIIRGGFFGKSTLKTVLDGRPLQLHELSIASERRAGVVGFHQVTYTNDVRDGSQKNDTIRLLHEAGNRSGFANGALDAALSITQNNLKGLINYSSLIAQRFIPLIIAELEELQGM